MRVPAIVELGHIVLPVPGHLAPGQKVTLGKLAVGGVVQVVVGDGIDQDLEGQMRPPSIA